MTKLNSTVSRIFIARYRHLEVAHLSWPSRQKHWTAFRSHIDRAFDDWI